MDASLPQPRWQVIAGWAFAIFLSILFIVSGAWKLGSQYFMREGMRLETSNSNKDDFERNLVSIRAEERLALAVYRPVCFELITGGTARS